ncbi:MAG: PEP-CTERM sorting domain-containing protein, partial [Planctomycetes bacterium]|nr:PEP-CTERM sorting domain-containing protein [Planctomycetota bacterium]
VMTGLGELPGGDFVSQADGVSADGSVVVGQSNSASGDEAFIWDSVHGMRSLRDVLINDFGLGPQLNGWTLSHATDISNDGMNIVGWGYVNGDRRAWFANIPEPATLSLLGLGGLLVTRRRR